MFAAVMQHYTARDQDRIPQLNYSGTLTMDLVGPGWDIQCESGSSPYRLMSLDEWVRFVNGPSSTYDGPPMIQKMFETTVEFNTYNSEDQFSDSSTILLHSSYKSTPGGNGTLSWRNCTLHEALIRYPLRVVNGIVTLQYMPLSENRTNQLIYRWPEDNSWGSSPSTIGGFWIALTNHFATSANMTLLNPSIGPIISNENANANTFISLVDDLESYDGTWSDPTDAIITAANEISLRAAINLTDQSPYFQCSPTCAQPEVVHPNLTTVNRTTSQQAFVTMVTSSNTYQTDRGWLIGGFFVIAFACIAIVPMYWGWWKVERTFTLNPLETAKAFDAPLLRDATTDVYPTAWAQSVKQMRVCYGTGLLDVASGTGNAPRGLVDQSIRVFLVEAVDVFGSSAESLHQSRDL